MKNRVNILVLLVLGIMTGSALYGQCTPDPACVDDDDIPGQFCPRDLPDGVINTLYDETVTVIPPDTFEIQDFGSLKINHIKIDSVENLPAGLDYFPNADIFYPDNSYCIQLSGTPTELGTDTLAIYITANVDIFGGLDVQVVDDTSITITILETSEIGPQEGSGLRVYQNYPNPFSELTRLNYYVPYRDRIELNVYNVLGVLVHHENEVVPPGAHSFSFDGAELQPGTYFYRVKSRESIYSGKLVKSR